MDKAIIAFAIATSISLAASASEPSPPPKPTAAASKKGLATEVCFGGPAQIVLDQVGPVGQHGVSGRWSNTLFQVADGQLLWSAGLGLHQVDLATLAASTRRAQRPMILVGAHGGEAFGIEDSHGRSFGGDLFAVELRTGEERTVLEGGVQQRFYPFQFDGDDLYFIRGPYDRHSDVGEKGTGFFRLRHTRGEPEFLGFEPHGTYTSFRVDHGYVYWNREVGKGGFELSRKGLAADAKVVRLATTTALHVPFALAQGKIYYLDDGTLWAGPIDGARPPAVISANAGTNAKDLVADRKCLYWTNHQGIVRARSDGKGAPEIIADADSYRKGAIATDGNFLYWHDPVHNRFLRMARDSRSLQPRPAVVAHAVDLHDQPADSVAAGTSVAVGDGWGCARVFGWNQANWQCWGAGLDQAAVPHVQARSVPWLSAAELPVGPDRLCFLSNRSDLCWPWPGFAQQRPSNLPEVQKREGRGSTQSRDGKLLIGGSFACTIQYVGSERLLKCSGDNSYGQLAEGEQPEMTTPWYGWHGTAGTWHGCVAARGRKPPYCWGRGDVGQLGFEASEKCAVAGHQVPCSKSLRTASVPVEGMSKLFAGDMFTCGISGSPRRLLCWGASRDGWISTAACPSGLRQAWPLPAGFLPAPQATCSHEPIEISELARVGDDLSVGPRGACGIVDKHIRCVGAIRTPSVEVTQVKVNPGVQASACGIADNKVVCWGEGYSPAGKPNVAVPIEFAASQPLTAVVDFPPRPEQRGRKTASSIGAAASPRCRSSHARLAPRASHGWSLPPRLRTSRTPPSPCAIVCWWRLSTGRTRGCTAETTKVSRNAIRDQWYWATAPLPLAFGQTARGSPAPETRPASVAGPKHSARGWWRQGILSGGNSSGWVLKSAELCELPNEGK